MMFHFDDVLWRNYMSVHLNDRVQLVEMASKQVKGYQLVSVRSSSDSLKMSKWAVLSEFSKSLPNEHAFRLFILLKWTMIGSIESFKNFVHCAVVAQKNPDKFEHV